MDTGVDNIVDEKYPTASSEWLQVIRRGTAKHTLQIGLYIYIYIYIYIFVYLFEFHTSWNSVSLELLLSFSLVLIFKIIRIIH
jgi:hypothetical protein